MNYICTWLCADEKGEESIFPQTGKLSSSLSHQLIYWRCVLVFYATSKRFNKQEGHILFTNVKELPSIDGKKIKDILTDLGVQIIHTDFKYKTPKGYFASFQNQFYEFSILEYINNNDKNKDNQYMILDSDCLFLKPASSLFEAAKPQGFISFGDGVAADYVIHGLSRSDMKELYEELLDKKIDELPSYHLGEFFLASVENIQKFYQDFQVLWPQLLERNRQGLKKFNEEAHTLSYLYFKNGFRASKDEHYMRRIWTNPVFYRVTFESDTNLTIWHLPAEKTFGIHQLYNTFFLKSRNYGLDISNDNFLKMVHKTVGIPFLPLLKRINYYVVSISRALKKRLIKK